MIGLLSLPEVFGDGACDRYEPGTIPVYTEPDAGAVVAEIRVARPWTHHEGGGCEGLAVHVGDPGAGAAAGEDTSATGAPLPVREYGYELPGAIVLDARDDWYRIRLPAGAGWVRASPDAEFFSLERLLDDGLTHLTPAWDGRLLAAPGPGAGREVALESIARSPLPGGAANVSARVVETERRDGRLWVRVEILVPSPCESFPGEPRVTASGWVPGHGAEGEPVVWFYSRGC